MLTYQPLRDILQREGKSIKTLMEEVGFTTNTAVKLKNDLPVRLDVIAKICCHLNVNIECVVSVRLLVK